MSDVDPNKDDAHLASSTRRCSICGGNISSYNTLGFCFRHVASIKEQKQRAWQEKHIQPLVEMILEWCSNEDKLEFSEYLLREGFADGPETAEEIDEMQKILAENNIPLSKGNLASVETVVTLVCEEFGFTLSLLLEKNRAAPLVLARYVLMYLLYMDTSLSYPDIAKELGGRDHTTVMYGVEKITALLAKENKEVKERIELIRSRYKTIIPETL